MWRADSLEKTLMLGKIEGRRKGGRLGWDGWMASLTRWTWDWVNSRSWSWTGRPGMLRFIGSQRVRHDWATELNWMLWINHKWKISVIGEQFYWDLLLCFHSSGILWFLESFFCYLNSNMFQFYTYTVLYSNITCIIQYIHINLKFILFNNL